MIGNDPSGLWMKAAQKALETGNAGYVLIWIPETSENALKNLLETTRCEKNLRNDCQSGWYFETVLRLHRSYWWSRCPGMRIDTPEKKPIVLMVEEAIETGDCSQILGFVQESHGQVIQQRFQLVMKKRLYPSAALAAGRDYVRAFIDFVAYLDDISLSSGKIS